MFDIFLTGKIVALDTVEPVPEKDPGFVDAYGEIHIGHFNGG